MKHCVAAQETSAHNIVMFEFICSNQGKCNGHPSLQLPLPTIQPKHDRESGKRSKEIQFSDQVRCVVVQACYHVSMDCQCCVRAWGVMLDRLVSWPRILEAVCVLSWLTLSATIYEADALRRFTDSSCSWHCEVQAINLQIRCATPEDPEC